MDVSVEDGLIYHDGAVVGHVEWSGNTLLDIGVEDEYEGNGIATAAVEILVERAAANGYETVQTTAVVSPAMETVLRRNGFERQVVTVEGPTGEPIEEIQWLKEL